ncbi:glycosyltransferase family 4 protein [Bosea sp. (in: a-proteobacteria)]|uniref:glycosyltransferase family 4 protein n=1 Tax=Bosea sp. (in: a-proteobacteria) TaxID=1871050 RepID=UPI00121320B1|nr:glycosyltransferase family 4 protein [Bosea sp. (in: a-proteobacteria)]TAJ29049.1 MAG: glycosyltransferase [Bosea sp. (in: a-proteobacteria)]
MRCVIVSDFGSVNGGAAKVAIESARGLAEAGVEVVFACAIGQVSDRLSHPNIAVEAFGGEEVWRVEGKLAAARQGIWNAKAHAFLTMLFGRQPPGTVIHLHQWTKAFSPAAIAAAGESGLPVAITLHDYFSFCPTGGYFDFQANAPCRLEPMSAGCVVRNCDRASYVHKLVRVARQWRSNKALHALKAPLFIHVSDFARRFAEPFLPIAGRHVVVENMMEAPRREPARVADNRHALFLGRFTQEKAGDLLAEAARRAEMPVRFVGEGPLQARIAAINPQAQIRGWVPAEHVFDEIAQARCLVLPSLWFEPGPLVVAEARSLGVPVVLARTTGPASWVFDGDDGLLVDGGDVDGLATALSRLKDDALASTMGAAAYRRYWADPLTTSRHVERTLAAYSRLAVA